MTDTVISVENLSKFYRLGLIGGGTLREDLNRWWAKARGKPDPLLKLGEEDHGNRKDGMIWALRNISFAVKEGEILGVIGRNGAGKSTLLKILSRITAPTEGRAIIRGRVGSLLEVGTGFHPELTGRENIYLNGAILGMSRLEIERKLDEIVFFSEIEKFLDTPVKRYSSGMHVRLAFSVAAHLEPEILLVDEVLAVGDMAFQNKCLGKMNEVSEEGRTVIFVSHNMGAITKLCSRGVVLEDGSMKFDGSSIDAVTEYQRSVFRGSRGLSARQFIGKLTDTVYFEKILINGQAITDGVAVSPDEELVIKIHGFSKKELSDFDIHASIYFDGKQLITLQDSPPDTLLREGAFVSRVVLDRHFLRPGTYRLGIGGYRPGGHQWLWGADIAEFTVLELWSDGYNQRSRGIVNSARFGTREQGKSLKQSENESL